MAYKIPWSNFHELNLDWLLQQVKKLREDVDGLIGGATPSDAAPEMDGAGTPGSSVTYSRGDHQHPTDTSRAAASDLTQEITDRGNADQALAEYIANVDAKIRFSSAAPIMDSSSASAGFSEYMARADHVHPTDTSRASATDLTALTARVDGFTGSANPSDTTPKMDGVGSAGTGGNYSRGDHRHPSDTSKLDKTGGEITGDLQIDRYLSGPETEQHISRVDAIGWIRIGNVPQEGGTLCKFDIVRQGALTPPETHSVLLTILQNNISFINEVSKADALYITKIRYTSAGAVDIYMDQNYTCNIGVYLDRRASTKEKTKLIKLVTPSGVSDTPPGETIITEYNFNLSSLPITNATLISKTRTYTSVVLNYNDSYTQIDSYTSMGVDNSYYCLGYTIKGWTGFPHYGINIFRSGSGTDFYLTGVQAGTYGSFSVEYWFIKLP